MVHIGSSLGSPSSDVEQSLSSDVSANLPRLRAGRPDRSAIAKGVPPLERCPALHSGEAFEDSSVELAQAKAADTASQVRMGGGRKSQARRSGRGRLRNRASRFCLS